MREDHDLGIVAIYLNGKKVFQDRVAGLKRANGKLGLWIGGYGYQAEPFDIRVRDIEIIRKRKK